MDLILWRVPGIPVWEEHLAGFKSHGQFAAAGGLGGGFI